MPIYEFSCPIHGRFELWFSLSDCERIQNGIPCKFESCKERAEKEWSQVTYPSHGLATTIFRNPRTGDIRTAVMRNQETPAGYVREDLKTPMDRSRVEREMQNNANEENEYVTERNRYLKEETQKNRQADLKARLGTITKDSENPSAAAYLVKKAMLRNRKRKLPPKKTEFHFAVNHQNKSNLDKG
jgi:hypothetical protein